MKVLSDKCQACKKCEKLCPVDGIDVDNNRFSKACIKCYHCAAICPEQAIDNSDNTIGLTSQNNIKPSDFELLMQQRRSHRIFTSRAVSPEILSEFIERMRYSPTASNLQSLQFTTVTCKEKLKEINALTTSTLIDAFKGINAITKPFIRIFLGKEALRNMEKSKHKFLDKANQKKSIITYNAPALILIHSTNNPVGMPCNDANIWTGMATLYAELLDLCTCINGYIVSASKRNKKLKATLQIPKDHTIHSAILIGYPKYKFENRIDRRKPNIRHITSQENQ